MSSLYIIFLVLTFFGNADSSEVHAFRDCSKPMNNVFKTYGTRVKSQFSRFYKGDDVNCTLIFKAAQRDMTFHLILLNVDIPSVSNGCVDSLTVKAYNQDLNNSTMLLEKYCGNQSNRGLITDGHYLEITWVGSKVSRGHKGFNLVITAVKNSQGPCDREKFFECEKGSCISANLSCDGVYNCINRTDEVGCFTTAQLVGQPGFSANNRDNTLRATTTEDPDDDDDDDDEFDEGMDSVSIMIMVGVLLLIVFGCFLVGCRKREAAENLVQRTLLRSWSRDNGRNARDPNYRGGEGRPATPPPSYSFIERQTSYVSDISITSSQLSFPPEYDEAVDMPDDPDDSQQRPRRMRFLSRRDSSRRDQRPLVHRVGTFSPGDINARRGSRIQRSVSDGERQRLRHLSDVRRHHPQRTSSGVTHGQGRNVPVPPLRFRIESTASSIFEEVFEDTMSHLSPVSTPILEEDVVFSHPADISHINNSNNNDLDRSSRSQGHQRGDDSDTALLDDDDSDMSSPNNGALTH